MSMVTAMMMMVGDHEYEYDDDTSDARGELLTNSNTEVLTLKFAIGPKHCCTVAGRQNRRRLTKHCCTVEKK